MMLKDKRSRSCWKGKRSSSGRSKQVSMSLKTRSQRGCGNEEVRDLVLKELHEDRSGRQGHPNSNRCPKSSRSDSRVTRNQLVQQLRLKTGDTGRVRPDPRSQTGAGGGGGSSPPAQAGARTGQGALPALPGDGNQAGSQVRSARSAYPASAQHRAPTLSPPHQGLAYSGPDRKHVAPHQLGCLGDRGCLPGDQPATEADGAERQGERGPPLAQRVSSGPPAAWKGPGEARPEPPTRRPGGPPRAGLGGPWETGQGPQVGELLPNGKASPARAHRCGSRTTPGL